jgi:hypothetical protein
MIYPRSAIRRSPSAPPASPCARYGKLKRHNPETVRKNTGEGYYGCLNIRVRRSGDFYRKIEGWMSAITASPTFSGA